MSSELKWWHLAIMGGMGAGGGYLVFKDKIGKYPSAAGGALATVLTVLAFRPGGWLRSSTTGRLAGGLGSGGRFSVGGRFSGGGRLGAAVRAKKSCRYIKVCEPSPLFPAPSLSNIGPNIGGGTNKSITGMIREGATALVINGTVVVRQGSKVIGHTTSAAGYFNLYDLAPGTYKITVTTNGGKTGSKNVSVGTGTTSIGIIYVG